MSGLSDGTWILDASDDLPHASFEGLAHVGADVVVGAAGADQHHRRTGRHVAPGHDGSYVTLARLDGAGAPTWRLGTDYHGFHKVFVHQDDSGWAVSNSFVALARHLRGRGIRLRPNLGCLAAWSSGHDMVRALMSFDTPIEGITLLPTQHVLHLRPGPTPSLQVVADHRPVEPMTYEEALAGYLRIAATRLHTILADERLRTTLHVTGGRDSRTVLSLVARGWPDVASLRGRVRFASNRFRRDDFAVATELADHFGFELNATTAWDLGAVRDPVDQFRAWEETYVGCYSHVIFPGRESRPDRFVLPGVGGEAHRTVYHDRYARATVPEIAERLRPRFEHRDHWEQWAASLEAADRVLAGRPDAHPNPMVRSHREFRDRFHTGKDLVWRNAVPLLSSQHLVDCSNRLPDDSFDDGQILFDIMGSSDPRLVHVPFDVASKAPTPHQLERVPSIGPVEPDTGTLFADLDDRGGDEVARHRRAPVPFGLPREATPLDHVRPRVLAAAMDAAVRDIIRPRAVERGLREMHDTGRNRQNLHHRGRRAHALYLTHLVLTDLCG